MTERVIVEGRGLHTGAPSRVTLGRCAGATRLAANGVERSVRELTVAKTKRATTVSEPRVSTVEHLFAALAALGLHEGIAIAVEGPELPLLDGGAARWCEGLAKLEAKACEARLVVVKDGVVEIGRSRYELLRSDALTEVRVLVAFDDARLEREASWLGESQDFVARIAPARTFAFANEIDELTSQGLASHVDPESVVVIAPDAIHAAGRPFVADEPARHKLLDLVGDLFLYGGPPIGRIVATRPGHGATHTVMRRAFELGLVAQSG